MAEGIFPEVPIQPDVRSFKASTPQSQAAQLLVAGFPCQAWRSFSVTFHSLKSLWFCSDLLFALNIAV